MEDTDRNDLEGRVRALERETAVLQERIAAATAALRLEADLKRDSVKDALTFSAGVTQRRLEAAESAVDRLNAFRDAAMGRQLALAFVAASMGATIGAVLVKYVMQ